MGLENPLHIAIILLVVLMVFGAKRLPEMGRSLGEGLRGFKESITGEHPHTDPEPAPAPPVPPVALAPAPAVAPAETHETRPAATHEESAPLQPVA